MTWLECIENSNDKQKTPRKCISKIKNLSSNLSMNERLPFDTAYFFAITIQRLELKFQSINGKQNKKSKIKFNWPSAKNVTSIQSLHIFMWLWLYECTLIYRCKPYKYVSAKIQKRKWQLLKCNRSLIRDWNRRRYTIEKENNITNKEIKYICIT